MRGGTTSLYAYLTDSPEVVGALRKEIHFFDLYYSKGWVWYLSHFPIQSSRRFLTGEASPNYLFYPESIQRIVEKLPEVKLIALLRNPIDRAYSDYQVEVATGYESLSFEDALSRECNIHDDRWQLKDLREKSPDERNHFSYLSRGIYVAQLRPWLENVSRDRFLVIKSEFFFNDPGKVLTQVRSFLGLPADDRKIFKKFNEGQYKPMSVDIRARLRAFFAPYNDELSRLLGMDFSEWR
jgi:hypothetical protein